MKLHSYINRVFYTPRGKEIIAANNSTDLVLHFAPKVMSAIRDWALEEELYDKRIWTDYVLFAIARKIVLRKIKAPWMERLVFASPHARIQFALRRNYTQAELARIAGMKDSTFREFVKNRRKPHPKTSEKINQMYAYILFELGLT